MARRDPDIAAGTGAFLGSGAGARGRRWLSISSAQVRGSRGGDYFETRLASRERKESLLSQLEQERSPDCCREHRGSLHNRRGVSAECKPGRGPTPRGCV